MRPNFASIGRPSFAAKPKPAGEAPTTFKGKALRRRQAMYRESQELLPFLPEADGESLHAITTGRGDLAVQLAATIGHYGSECQSLRIATLSFNRRNVSELSELLRSGKVGTLTLLCSLFFQRHNRDEFADTRRETANFPGRWRLAAGRNHAKVACLDLAGRKITVESSANLRSNGNSEQVTIIQDPALHDWHAAWIDQMVTAHETAEAEKTPAE